jgi:hypothetical protein
MPSAKEKYHSNKYVMETIKFEPATIAFKDICYTITLPNGEELDLLSNVSGYFKPG